MTNTSEEENYKSERIYAATKIEVVNNFVRIHTTLEFLDLENIREDYTYREQVRTVLCDISTAPQVASFIEAKSIANPFVRRDERRVSNDEILDMLQIVVDDPSYSGVDEETIELLAKKIIQRNFLNIPTEPSEAQAELLSEIPRIFSAHEILPEHADVLSTRVKISQNKQNSKFNMEFTIYWDDPMFNNEKVLKTTYQIQFNTDENPHLLDSIYRGSFDHRNAVNRRINNSRYRELLDKRQFYSKDSNKTNLELHLTQQLLKILQADLTDEEKAEIDQYIDTEIGYVE